MRLSENGEARVCYEEALSIYLDIGSRVGEANCIQALGDMHVMLSENEEARVRYEEALSIYRAIGDRVGEANCIQAVGDVSLEQGDEAAALAAYQDAFDRFMALGLPNDAANVLTSQTNIFDRRREYDHSLPFYTRAIELAPNNPMRYCNRALCFINLKDANRALADLKTATRLQPGHPYLEFRRGDVALLQKQYEIAGGYYQAFIGAMPRNNGGHFGLAWAHFGQGETDKALASLENALALTYSPQNIIDAIDELTEMQSYDPDLTGINQGLEMLREWLDQREN